MKKIRLPRLSRTAVIAAVMAFSLCMSAVISAAGTRNHIRESLVRLHILADSDSEYDQQLKLKVRDAILASSDEIFEPYSKKAQAESSLAQQLPRIKEIAEQTLRENGCTYPVSCELTQMEFDTRYYERYTVPDGEYTALRITIGSGSGKNWWCVMYPPLCVPCAAAEGEDILKKYGTELTDEDIAMLTESGDYEVRFYIAEVIEKLAGKAAGSPRS